MSAERIYFQQINKLEQENKQLKADIEDRDNKIYDLRDIIIDNKKYTETESKKLEKIRDLLNLKQSDGYAYVNDYDLVEILNEGSK